MSAPPPLLASLRHSSLDDTADDDKGGWKRGLSPPPSRSCPPPHPLLPAVLAPVILSQLSPPLFLSLWRGAAGSLYIQPSNLFSFEEKAFFFSLLIQRLLFTLLKKCVFSQPKVTAADRGRPREQRQEGNRCDDMWIIRFFITAGKEWSQDWIDTLSEEFT